MKKINYIFLMLLLLLSSPRAAQAEDLGNYFAFGGIATLGQGLGYLTKVGFSIAAIGVVFYFLIGATKMIFSGGDKNAVAGARGMITHAIIGFILLMLMFVLLLILPKILGIDFSII